MNPKLVKMKTLRFTTTAPGFMGAADMDTIKYDIPEECSVEEASVKGSGAYIHGDAEELAGYDIPVLFDGDLSQLDKPVDEQEIVMHLNEKAYDVCAELQINGADAGKYYLTLKKDKGVYERDI